MTEFKNVSFSYGETPILKDLSFSLNDGENLFISGASGCGKTTVARLILGILSPDKGSITAPEKISAVFQEDRLIERINVLNNITLPLKKSEFPFAEKLIDEFALSDIKYKSVSKLSGGMKRRVAIIRAIAFCGDALLLDEPFNGIDRDNVRKIAEIINRQYTERGKSVIIISHNKEDAELFGAKTLYL